MQIPHGQDATTVARRNLIRIAKDGKYLGATNAGYCHWFAAVRMLLGSPEFIRMLRRFKQNYFKNNKIMYDDNILKILGTHDGGYTNQSTKSACWPLVELLCRRTDVYGNLRSEKQYANNHEAFPSLQSALRGISPDYGMKYFYKSHNVLSNIISIMNETNDNIQVGQAGTYKNFTKNKLDKWDAILNGGQCITVGASRNHFYNVLKDNDGYWVIGSGKPILHPNLQSAIKSHTGIEWQIFTPPTKAPLRLHPYDTEKEIELYRNYGYKPWEHGSIKLGDDPLPANKKFMLDYLVQQIKQANWNKQVAWNNFLNHQKFNNQYMMNVCCNNWHYNNNLGIIAFNNACKVVNNNPILMAYYNQKMNGMIK